MYNEFQRPQSCANPLLVFQPLNCNNYAVDRLISLKFGTRVHFGSAEVVQ